MYKPKFVVIITTYLRAEALGRCLNIMENQTRLPDELVIVVRDTDLKTREFIEKYRDDNNLFRITVLFVSIPGYLPPLKEGLRVAEGDYVGILDDDVLVKSNWVEKALLAFYESGPRIGAVVGAQFCSNTKKGNVFPAKLSWFGRFAVIKNLSVRTDNINAFCEGNMVFRGEISRKLEVDFRLNNGRIAHHGLDLGLQVIGSGWKILYEPLLNAEHLALQEQWNIDKVQNIQSYVANLAIIIKKHFGKKRLFFFAIYNIAMGQYSMPGLLYFLFKNKVQYKNVSLTRIELLTALFQST
jgi:glycosyltransferase involved in cell wall biosynthesis